MPGECPPDLIEFDDALKKLTSLHNGGTENHIDKVPSPRARLAAGFEWYGEWSGDRFRTALNTIRDQIPESVVDAWDEYVESGAAWVEADKEWLSEIEVISLEQFDDFQFFKEGFSKGASGDFAYMIEVDDSFTQSNPATDRRSDAQQRHFDALNRLRDGLMVLDRAVVDLEGGLLSASAFPSLACNVELYQGTIPTG